MRLEFFVCLTIDWAISRALEGEKLGIALDDMVDADLDFADNICLLDKTRQTHRSFVIKWPKTQRMLGLK